MNVTRGLFRLWLVLSTLFSLAVLVVFFARVKGEFDRASIGSSTSITKMLPVDCAYARGVKGTDYTSNVPQTSDKLCWYEEPKFRKFYPEYSLLPVSELAASLYAGAGITLTPPRPWRALGESVLIAIIPPLFIFVVGWLLLWAFRSFRRSER
jgi:hypothetical protein